MRHARNVHGVQDATSHLHHKKDKIHAPHCGTTMHNVHTVLEMCISLSAVSCLEVIMGPDKDYVHILKFAAVEL